ncbi:hypothetical protein [Leptospira fletcheri]|uniref:hypothetical protein n=1 Tax=Leptospira fletcheri TaxID=2484981 RepID=UPI001AF00537|nr:hypothetical protein [Leptospira fletcheri]
MTLFLVFLNLFFLFLGTLGCSSVSVPGGGRFGAELIQEQAILDFYGTEEERAQSLKLLRSACRSLRPDRGLACYNLSVLYQSMGEKELAAEYSQRAKTSDPKDPLYAELVFQNSLSDLKPASENDRLDEGEQALKKAVQACKEGKKAEASGWISPLVSSGEISKETLSRGIFQECGIDSAVLATAKPNSRKPSLEYYKTLEKNHPYRKVWDLAGEFGRNPKAPSENPVTRSWKEFRASVSAKDLLGAKKHLFTFRKSLEDLSKEGQTSKQLALQLKKAAFLLLSEDSAYARFKDLAKELSDTTGSNP